VAFFGEISSGKSSLIKALIPEAEVDVAVSGGTTGAITRYFWSSPAGDRLVLSDMPGLDEPGREQDEAVKEEAMRAHLVIYVCEGDLNREQLQALESLSKLKKPMILALNKSDRLQTDELEQVNTRLRQRLDELGQGELVSVSAGGRKTVVRILADGSEEARLHEFPPQVDELARAIQRKIDDSPRALQELRDSAVFVLVSQRLDEAQRAHRREEADRIISGYSKKALVGAVAAMTPGSDIIIQGYLATQMIKELTKLYDTQVRKVDVELLLELVQEHVRGHTTLLLAIAGNALKAFPGVGTLAGGVLHAIAYGMLFEALGRGVSGSLESRGELHPVQVATRFKESLGENFTESSKAYAKLALAEIRRTAGRD
jgi:GTP-binding protein EngB required for normal cell division